MDSAGAQSSEFAAKASGPGGALSREDPGLPPVTGGDRLCVGADPLHLPQEWTCWEENYSRLKRAVDEAEAVLNDGGTEEDEEELTEKRLEACQVLPAHLHLQFPPK